MSVSRRLGQDEFLAAPPLFKFGPWVLIVVGAFIAVLSVLAGNWRITEGRKGVYENAFQLAGTSATAATENLTRVHGQLRQTRYALESLKNSVNLEKNLTAAFSAGLGLQGSGIEVALISASGTIIKVTKPGLINPSTAKAIGVAAEGQLRDKFENKLRLFLPAWEDANGVTRLPVVERISLAGEADYVVYLIDSQLIAGPVKKSLSGQDGWIQIAAKGGRILYKAVLSKNDGTLFEPEGPAALTVAAAMSHPLNYASNRLLVTTIPSALGGFTIQVGLSEHDALADFKSRVDATWLIVFGMATFVLSITCLTAFALGKFAYKETHLRRLATIDILTELPNRRSFHELLTKATAISKKENQTLGLIFMDLDNFKDINDSLGHHAGDSLLRHAAEALRISVRKGDRVCRLGGDEFTVILNDLTDSAEAQAIGDRILEKLAEMVVVRGVEIRSKASIGIALMPQHALNGEDLMRFADTAMYFGKHDGKGCATLFRDEMAARAVERTKTAQELEKGIFNNELFLVYQPKFSLKTGALTGHEALVRWNHPTRGIVYPNDFISIAEESGHIVDLGNWVLERSIRQLREWHDEGEGWHKIAVNVSALQLRGDDFVNRVHRLLAECNVAGKCLQLELTESSLASDQKKAEALVRALRKLGATVAVDDFGTGYSSLSALQGHEIDCLKVDRSFVIAMHTTQGNAVCDAVVSLGHAMSMYVIAEGVETVEQRDALVALGCDEVQGYLFAKPVAPDIAVKFGRSTHPMIVSRGAAFVPRTPVVA